MKKFPPSQPPERDSESIGSASFEALYDCLERVLKADNTPLVPLVSAALDFFDPLMKEGVEMSTPPTLTGIFDGLRQIIQAPEEEMLSPRALLRSISRDTKGVNTAKLDTYQTYLHGLINEGKVSGQVAAFVLDQFIHHPLSKELGIVYDEMVRDDESQSREDVALAMRQKTRALFDQIANLGELNERNQMLIGIGSEVSAKVTGARVYMHFSPSANVGKVVRDLVGTLTEADATETYLKLTRLGRRDFLVVYAGELDLIPGNERVSPIEQALNDFFMTQGVVASLGQGHLPTGLPVKPGVTVGLIPPIDLLITAADSRPGLKDAAKKSYNHLYTLMISLAQALAEKDYILSGEEEDTFDYRSVAQNYYRQIQRVCGINPDTLEPQLFTPTHVIGMTQRLKK